MHHPISAYTLLEMLVCMTITGIVCSGIFHFLSSGYQPLHYVQICNGALNWGQWRATQLGHSIEIQPIDHWKKGMAFYNPHTRRIERTIYWTLPQQYGLTWHGFNSKIIIEPIDHLGAWRQNGRLIYHKVHKDPSKNDWQLVINRMGLMHMERVS